MRMRPSRRLLLVSAVLGIALAFHAPLRRGAVSVARFPFTVLKAAVGTVLAIPRLPLLLRDDRRLRVELMQRQLEVAALREQLHLAARTQALRDGTPEHTSEGIVASVIGRSAIPTQHTVLLDRGAREGLRLDGVILDAGGMAGRIVEVHARTALALLLTDSESRVGARLARSRETGLLAGRGRGRCELIYLDAEADATEGDEVVTAGLGGPFPKGLRLGRVSRLIRDEASGAASAWVEPAAEACRRKKRCF